MVRFVLDLLWNKQSFATALANVASALALVGAACTAIPAVRDALVAIIPPDWLPFVVAAVGLSTYASGAMSGGKAAAPSAEISSPTTPTGGAA